MAIYFLNLQMFSRGKGSSAVSAAAYRAGELIRDERTGKTYDHTARRDVLYKEVLLPNDFSSHDMSWAKDRSVLWNLAEKAENRRDARVAREYLVALPAELAPAARIKLASDFSRELVENYGFALDMTIHTARDYPGSDPRNFHAHLLATTREMRADGLGPKTTLEWNNSTRRRHGLGSTVGELFHVRERWALTANLALEQSHSTARIDHRTLEAQGIDREPAAHIPHAAFEMERHGQHSFVAERIRAQHKARVEARAQRPVQQIRLAPPTAAPKMHDGPAKQAALKWRRQYVDGRYPERQKSSQQLQAESVLRWQRYRANQLSLDAAPGRKKERSREQTPSLSLEHQQTKSRDWDHSL